jgi:hypothetical protein
MSVVKEIKKYLKRDADAADKEVQVITAALEDDLLNTIENRLEVLLRAKHKSNALKIVMEAINKRPQKILSTLKTAKKNYREFLERGVFNSGSSAAGKRLSAMAQGEVYGKLLSQFDAYIEWLEEEEELLNQKRENHESEVH